jgi:mono/diheme cytochrome c family protein
MAILVGMPFIDRTRERRVSRRPIAIGFAGAMAVLLLTLTWKGSSAPNIEGKATATGPGIAFVKQQSCGSCHTLKAMGWGGNIGPNLDSRHPTYALAVERLTKGAAPMPSFKGTFTDAQLKCVATVVAVLTKGGGNPTPQAQACKGL